MSITDATCWTVIRGAAAGHDKDRSEFARRYESIIRAYLAARWKNTPLVGDIDDATQEVFVDCFREQGALTRADPERRFRSFLYGVVQNVARRTEDVRAKAGVRLDSRFDATSRERSGSEVFDRAWAQSLLKQAAALNRMRARGDERAFTRAEILRLRFQDNLPIRDIAAHWKQDAAWVHHEYATARDEFKVALQDVVAEHQPGTPGEIERECRRLFDIFD